MAKNKQEIADIKIENPEDNKTISIKMLKNAFGEYGTFLVNKEYENVDYNLGMSFINEKAAIRIEV